MNNITEISTNMTGTQAPVSYTHLDVYKRQDRHSMMQLADKIIDTNTRINELDNKFRKALHEHLSLIHI